MGIGENDNILSDITTAVERIKIDQNILVFEEMDQQADQTVL